MKRSKSLDHALAERAKKQNNVSLKTVFDASAEDVRANRGPRSVKLPLNTPKR